MWRETMRLARSNQGIATAIGIICFFTMFMLMTSQMLVWTMRVGSDMAGLDQERAEEEIKVAEPGAPGIGGEVYVEDTIPSGGGTGLPDSILTFDSGTSTGEAYTLSPGYSLQVTDWIIGGYTGRLGSVTVSIRYQTGKGFSSTDTYLLHNASGQWESAILIEASEDYTVLYAGISGVDSWEKLANVDVLITNYDTSQKVIVDRIWMTVSSTPLPTADIFFNCTNTGGNTAHIVSAWILWSNDTGEYHDRYDSDVDTEQLYVDVDAYIPPGGERCIVLFRYSNGYLHSGHVVVKVVTERGNTASSGYDFPAD